MGFVVQAESQDPELSLVITLEFDADALEYYDQPETLRVQGIDKNGKRINKPYTPDYLVLSKEHGPILYECKKEEHVEKFVKDDKNWWMDKDGEFHYEPLRTWCMDHGMKSKVSLSSDIPAQRVQNLQMLAAYYGENVPPASDEARTRILAALTSTDSPKKRCRVRRECALGPRI